MTVAVTAFGKGIDHVGAGFVVDGIAIVALAGGKHGREFLAPTIGPRSIDLIARAGGDGQSIDHVSSHERIGLVILPPTPAAVLVLISVQTIHALLNFLI